MDDRLDAALDRVRAAATALAASIGDEARASTTVGIERAVLRLVGVGGLDLQGRPLAATVVERAIGDDPARLARGVLLPLVAASILYEASPAEVARDVASGAIDLDLEAEALADPLRASEVSAAAEALVAAAFARIDDNRTARLDLVDVLGDPPLPIVGVPVRAAHVDAARDEVAALIAGGADAVRIDVPASRELADLLPPAPGVALTGDGARSMREARAAGDAAPTGSQRALAIVREVVDQAAAERRAYARLAAVPRALGGPELSVVAGTERLDTVHADPMTEIVVDGVDPARALADHSFLRRVLSRAGCRVVIDAGPLVVGPDLGVGVPAGAVVHAGRALALQALSIALARRDGLADDQLLAGSLPEWILDERSAGAIALALVSAQQRLHPGIGLLFTEPAGDRPTRDRWRQLRTMALLVAGGAARIDRDADVETVASLAAETRGSADFAARLAAETGPVTFGPGLDATAVAVADAAATTLLEMGARGWDAIVGPLGAGAQPLAQGTAVARREAPDAPAMGIVLTD